MDTKLAGKKGGLSTKKKMHKDFYKEIGARGGRKTQDNINKLKHESKVQDNTK